MVLACTKEKYTEERFKNWETGISKIADKIPIFYLFGKSTVTPTIPTHKNVSMIVADCGDNYEDIPLKIYYGVQYLRNFSFSYIVKIDENLMLNDPLKFIEIVNKEMYDTDYMSMSSVLGTNNINKTHLSTWHQMRTHDKRFMFLPSIVYELPYASGPAYAISKKAADIVKKEYFMSSMFEDYAMGYNLYNHNIFVSKSSIINSGIIYDPGVLEVRSFPRLNVPINTKPQMDAHISRLAYTRSNYYIYIFGGLGNQLFQIATGLAYAIRNEGTLQLCTMPLNHNGRSYYWDSLLIKCKPHLTSETPSPTYKEPAFSYKEIPNSETPVVLWGYFQSAKYFKDIVPAMKYMLSFPNSSMPNIIKKYGDICTPNHVIVHARRGDYMSAIDYHGVMTTDYYMAAKEEMKRRVSDPTFVLISDDMEYWKSSDIFKDEKTVFFDDTDIQTLSLMINSHNFIIANSTFSWWGATMSRSTNIIAPKQWFGPKGPQDWSDIYDPAWTLL